MDVSSAAEEIEEIKAEVGHRVDAQRQELIQLSLKIHDNPELGLQEKKAASWLISYLQRNGFQIKKHIAGLPTAFQARYGQGSPRLALLAEYDALPQVGHACGHNIIAASAVGAGVASKLAIDRFGGSIIVMGAPAEENLGAKIDMVKAGIFDEIDVAMMTHPDVLNLLTIAALACASVEVEFFGRPAHAAAQPYEGINALEALILSFNSINSLRQHIKEEARIHGIITDGGDAPNIVPAHSAAEFLIRAMDNNYIDELKEKVLNCFKGAALATGARLEYKWDDKVYAPMKNNMALAQLFKRNLESLGRHVELSNPFGFGSTDMGNVSQVVPSIHPMVAIASREVLIHSPEFASAAASEAGHKGLLDAATAMSMTVVDIMGQPGMLDKIRQEFCNNG